MIDDGPFNGLCGLEKSRPEIWQYLILTVQGDGLVASMARASGAPGPNSQTSWIILFGPWNGCLKPVIQTQVNHYIRFTDYTAGGYFSIITHRDISLQQRPKLLI
jgi:hypothetical protein